MLLKILLSIIQGLLLFKLGDTNNGSPRSSVGRIAQDTTQARDIGIPVSCTHTKLQ